MKRLSFLTYCFALLTSALCLIWTYGLVFSAGDVSNTHFRSDTQAGHRTTDPHTRIYEMRLDSGIAWGTVADSNRLATSWVTPWTFLGRNRIGFMYIFRVTRIDTTYTIDDMDSILISVETCANPDSWYPNINTIHEFTVLNDTGTCAKYFPPCSATVQAQVGYVRSEIVYSCWQDSAADGSISDTLTHVPILFEQTIIPVD